MNIIATILSLRFRLMFFALLVTLPVFALVLYGDWEQRRDQLEAIQTDMLRTARDLASGQNRMLNEAHALMTMLGRVPDIRDGVQPDCDAFLAEFLETSAPYAFLGVATPEGDLLCSVPQPDTPINLGDRPYFAAALADMRFSVGEYQIGRVTNRPVVGLALPIAVASTAIDDEAGLQEDTIAGSDGDSHAAENVRAVILASIDLGWLDQQIEDAPLPDNATVTILDRNGVILHRHPEPERWMGRVGQEYSDVVVTILAQQAEGTTEAMGMDDVGRLYGFTPLYVDNGHIGGYVAVGIPSAVAFVDLNQRQMRNWLWMGGAALLIALLAWVGGDLLIRRRVGRLARVTRQLAAGNLTARANLGDDVDEISQLGQAFDAMAESLQHNAQQQEASEAALRRYATRMQALVGIGNRLNAHLELSEILSAICQETADALQVQGVSLSLYDAKLERFFHAADVGMPADYAQRVQAVARAYVERRIAATDRQVTLIERSNLILRPDVQSERPGPNAELYAELDMRTIVSIRLDQGGELIGRLNLHTFGETREFDDEELALFRGLANQAAQALANARLYADAQRNLGRLRALSAIDNAILQTHELAKTLDVIIEQIALQLEVDAAAVLLVDRATNRLRYATGTGFRHDAIGQSDLRVGEGHAGQAAQSREIEFVPDLNATDQFMRRALVEGEDFVSYMAIPLVAHDRVLGVIDIFQRSPLHRESEWSGFAWALAMQTAIAIDHAGLFSETRRLLEQTRQQTQQLENVLHTVPEGILFLDEEHRIELANRAALECLPYLSDAGVGEQIEMFADVSLSTFLMETGSVGWREVVVSEPHRIFEVAARPLEANDALAGWVLVLNDITQERLHQEKIQGQERLASVGQLAAGIAHDFNNILTPILIYTDMLIAAVPEGERLRRYLHEIQKATHRAKELIAHILTFSRQEMRSDREQMALLPVIDETIKLVRAALPATIEIEMRCDADVGAILGNSTQIHQMLMNLATNAFHAMQEKGGRLTVELAPVMVDAEAAAGNPSLEPGAYARLSVHDTGQGMEPDVRARIFEPFFTTKEVGQGTGMGLSVVHGIVRGHEGAIEVESEPGEGTVFHIYLPLLTEVATAEQKETSDVAGGVESILVVDDESSIVSVIESVLQSLGYRVTGMTNGASALEHFQADPARFDLVITDLTMPRMTGERLAEELLRLRPELPVILVSGYNENVTLEQLRAIGIRDYLRKPFSVEDLARSIRNVLDQTP